MPSDPARRPGLAALDDALAAGDIEGARSALLRLDAEERALLQAQMGAGALEAAYRHARRRRRGPALGRVIVLPGLMGTELDAVNAHGNSDLVWVHYLRLFQGRLADLRLTPEGKPLVPPPVIKPKKLYAKVYLPLLLALEERWQTRPFPYDWRGDVDRSAELLADEIRAWAGGEPVHLVAHSLGGVVARRFIQKFPDVWDSMQDRTGQGRGGRLVMMGTPNRGSYAIPLALSGEEETVKTLDKLDFQHDRTALLRILNTFLGSYQLLPSARIDLGDDHRKLFAVETWGRLPVHQELLDRGKAFMSELDPVIDPGRLLYVAGYNQETPHRIHVEAPGRFRYESTLDGDGRVTHELGLLEGVRTFWVVEAHGDLVKNSRVLAGIHDLLQKGTTSALESRRAAVRATRGRTPYDPRRREVPDPEVDALVAQLRPARAARRPLTFEQERAAARLEALVGQSWLGKPPAAGRDAAAALPPRASSASASPAPARLRVEVVWGDITRAAGDVFTAGQYRGVLPQDALLALDHLVSGTDEPPLVLTEQARRGLLRGDLGDVEFFPLPNDRLVAVGGMGHAGAFGDAQLRLLARNLTWAIANLPRPRTICTVLIGAGEGNLSVPAAVRALFQGLGDAVADARVRSRVQRLRIVERSRERAGEILAAVQALDLGAVLALDVARTVVRGAGGSTGRGRRPAPRATRVRERATAARLSFVKTPEAIRTSVITRTATIPERSLRLDPTLVDELVVRMKDPDAADVPRLAALLRRLLLPRDFVGILPFQSSAPVSGEDDAPVVFEVDRHLARVHWEMMAADLDAAGGGPLALRKQVARQLRTEYSPPPAPEANPAKARRALVIGDPGDPEKGMNLPGARREALRVADILSARGIEEVVCYVGARTDPEQAALGVPPATRIDVLERLLEGGWDILHYAGHGDFLPDEPDRAGWVFQDGLLTSRELERMDTAPRLVVSNACLSSLTSGTGAAGGVFGRSDAHLVATLADEFFRRGVRDYVGTAWEVNDEGAILFAEALYETLLGGSGDASLGAAMLRARRALAEQADVFGTLWAAYQHYGDPTASLVDLTLARPARPRPSRAKRRQRPRGRRRPS